MTAEQFIGKTVTMSISSAAWDELEAAFTSGDVVNFEADTETPQFKLHLTLVKNLEKPKLLMKIVRAEAKESVLTN